MHGIFTLFRKELEDHFSSVRFLLISALIVMVGVIIASMVGMGIQEESKGMAKPTLLFLWRQPIGVPLRGARYASPGARRVSMSPG